MHRSKFGGFWPARATRLSISLRSVPNYSYQQTRHLQGNLRSACGSAERGFSNSGRSLRRSHAGRSRVNWAKAGSYTEGSSRPPT